VGRKRRHWPFALKEALIVSQRGKCWICGDDCTFEDFTEAAKLGNGWARYPTFEHKVPIKDGGADELHNLAISHQQCNSTR